MKRWLAGALLGFIALGWSFAQGLIALSSPPLPPALPGPQTTPATATSTSAPARKPIFWDSTQYSPVTTRSKIGLPACQSTNGTINGKTDKNTVQWWSLRWSREGVEAIVLDIEDLSYDLRQATPDECKRNAEACAAHLRWAREAAPNVKIGLFGYPFAYPSTHITNLEAGAKGFQGYREAGDFLKPILGPFIDFSCPDLYTRDLLDKQHDPTGGILQAQRLWIIASVAECRRLYPDKPVYPYLSPAYVVGGSNLRIGEDMPGDAFAAILEACGLYADGAIIWGGWGRAGRLSFNADDPWVKALKGAAK